MRHVSATLIILLAVAMASCGPRQESSIASSTIEAIAASHIDGNVPTAETFDAILNRDLLSYFSTLSSIRVTNVSSTLLRKEPTQSGISYPKYYAWVVLRSDTNETRSGAVRLVAIDKARFEVTDFLSKETLLADPAAATKIFPAALIADINKRALE